MADSEAPEKSENTPHRPLFMVVMWSLPVVFFFILEAGLWLGGYGDDLPLFVSVPDFPQYQYQNRDVARRYFHHQARVPTGLSDVFRTEKDSLVYRIFVQGGSSAAGYPYYYGGSFSRMLEQRLQQTFPDREIEVVNTALAAVNSYTMLDFADEIIEQEPDLILMYAGHNEYYGALGVGSSESLGRFPAMIRLYLTLRHFRTVQLLGDLLSRAAGLFSSTPAGDAPGRTLMERMVGQQEIPIGSVDYQAGLDQFRGNLKQLLAKYAEHGIPVYVGTIVSNERDQPPFISKTESPDSAERYDRLVSEGRILAGRADPAAAIDEFTRAISLDSVAADAFYYRGRVEEKMGKTVEARADFHAARDRDQLRFRAPNAINQILLEESRRSGATVVETSAAMHRASPAGLVGNSLILEHLHPNVGGYFEIANAFYEKMKDDRLIGLWSNPVPRREAQSEILMTAVDSLFGAFRLRQLKGSWPFQPPGTFDRSLDTLRGRTPEEVLALGLIRSEITWFDATSRLRAMYMQTGRYYLGLKAALAMIQQYPFLPTPYAFAGESLARLRRLTEAMNYFEAANERQESIEVLIAMGNISALRGDAASAIRLLERAHSLAPDRTDAAIPLAAVYVGTGQGEKARSILSTVLQRDPENPRARELMAQIAPTN